jgi:hypothetical protein
MHLKWNTFYTRGELCPRMKGSYARLASLPALTQA